MLSIRFARVLQNLRVFQNDFGGSAKSQTNITKQLPKDTCPKGSGNNTTYSLGGRLGNEKHRTQHHTHTPTGDRREVKGPYRAHPPKAVDQTTHASRWARKRGPRPPAHQTAKRWGSQRSATRGCTFYRLPLPSPPANVRATRPTAT